MAHRIIGDREEGNIVKVFEPYKCTFARYEVVSVTLGEEGLQFLTLMRGKEKRRYIVREQLSKNDVRATLIYN